MKLRVALVCLAGALTAGGMVYAQGKKGEPSKYPGIMVFRCQAFDSACPSLTSPDRALGNGNSSNYALLPDGSAGAGLYRSSQNGSGPGSGEMHFNPGPESNHYWVTLDFAENDGDRCMNPYLLCFPYGGSVEVKTKMEIQNAVVDAAGQDIAYGLFSVPLNGEGRARIRFDFYDPSDSAKQWRVHFSSVQFQGADDIKVTRTALCTWVFEAARTDRAGVWGYQVPPGRRKAERVDYGLWHVPFQLTFKAYVAPIPNTSQTCPPS